MSRSTPRSRTSDPHAHAPRARRLGPWRNDSLLTVGVVGGIGSGKSTVAQLLGQSDALSLNADQIGHVLLDQRPTRVALMSRFGPSILHFATGAEPTVDRATLAGIVFADEAALHDLEAILHPRMRQTFEKAIARAARKGQDRLAILDAAILYEAGWSDLCDAVVFVDAPEDQRLARVQAHRGWTAETLRKREQAQWPLEQKRNLADFLIRNDGDLEALSREADQLRRTLLSLNLNALAKQRAEAAEASAQDPNAPPSPE